MWSLGLCDYPQGQFPLALQRAREALESIHDYLRERRVFSAQLRRSTGSLDEDPNDPIVKPRE
jgi:hypothetical protein